MHPRYALGLAALAALAACSSFNVREPAEGAVIMLPNATPVRIEGNPSLSGVRLRVDGTDQSNQLMLNAAGTQSTGNLNLPAGHHTLEMEADVPCWYCTGQSYHPSAQRKICVAVAGSLTTPSKTPRSNTPGNPSWSTASADKVVIAAVGVGLNTRWNFRRVGGLASSTGLIESIQFPCRCLRSMDAAQGTPIGMALCDPNDPLQQWQSLQATGAWAPGNLRFQNNGRGISDACLTEGPPPDGLLIQRACNDTPNQVWRMTDNVTGQSGGSPWFP